MPGKKRTSQATVLALEVGGLTSEVKEIKTTLKNHVAEEHRWLGKLDAVTTRLEALDSIKVNGNVGLEKGLQDIYKKTDQVSAQVRDLHDVLRVQIDRRRVMDDLTKWMEHSRLTSWITTRFARTLWLLILGALLWENKAVLEFVKSLF